MAIPNNAIGILKSIEIEPSNVGISVMIYCYGTSFPTNLESDT